MAGIIPTQISEAQARRHQIITWQGDPTVQYIPIFIAERAMVLESTLVRYTAASSGGACTAVLKYAASGTALSSGTTMTSAADFEAAADTTQTLTLVSTRNVPTQNIIPAGSVVGLAFVEGAPHASVGVTTVTLRVSDLSVLQ